MEPRAAVDRADERRPAVAVAIAVALAVLLAVGGVGIAAGGGSAAPVPDDEPSNAFANDDRPAALDTATSAATQSDGPPVGESFQEAIDPDSVRLTVSIEADGTARWRIEYWTELNDDNETAAFEELRDDVAANPDEYTARFANRTNRTVAAAENATGREMSAGEFGVSTRTESIPQEYGVLTYTFAWRNFAVVDGDRLRIGDAIEGFYLNDKTRLVVEWPAEYSLAEATPEPDEPRDRAVLWRGSRTDFVSGEPLVVVESGGASGGGDEQNGGGGSGSGPPLLWIGVTLALVALAGGGAAVLRRTSGGDGTPEAGATTARDAEAATGTDVGGTPNDGAGADLSSASPASQARQDEADDGSDSGDDGPPPELLSNEERVRRLLEAQDGRMRQQEVVAETGWTEAKTSQVVSEMREAGTIETFRLGRENVLKLSDGEDADE